MVSMEIGSTAQLATTLTGNSWQDELDDLDRAVD